MLSRPGLPALHVSSRWLEDARRLPELFKLRIGLAIAFTALAGYVVSPADGKSPARALALAISALLASAAAGAFNQYAERDLDARMRRTRARPFASGHWPPGPAWLVLIAAVGAAGVAMAGSIFGPATAAYLFLGAFTYGVVYTVWLKRRSAWNIVIGGLAGSFSVLAGDAAAGAPTPTLRALAFAWILFLWTPPHFWSLAIALREDYESAGVPMLPVVVGPKKAARIVFLSAMALSGSAFLPVATGLGGIYVAATAIASVLLLVRSRQLARSPIARIAMLNFHATLAWLVLVLLGAMLDSVLIASWVRGG